MHANRSITFVLLTTLLCYVGAVFYHKPSLVEVRPGGEIGDTNDFGFSIAFQKNEQYPKLVVGAPHTDRVGAVYTCPLSMNNLLEKLSYCTRVVFDDTKFDQNRNDTNQSFLMGASVIATPNYFLSCAPLWTAVMNYEIKNNSVLQIFPLQGSYGTCFIFFNNNPTAIRIEGLLEQYIEKRYKFYFHIGYPSMYGGVGWSILSDPINNLLLIGNPGAGRGDIQYLSRQDPQRMTKSIYFNGIKAQKNFHISSNFNTGYALTSGKFFSNYNETLYAFSLQDGHFGGKVYFLRYNGQKDKLHLMVHSNMAVEVVGVQAATGSMFGCALGSADVTAHGRVDLLVGAAAHNTHKNGYEAGALFIYLGGDVKSFDDKSRKRVVLGEKDGGRFGTTIAANDLDNDGLPEIFVSAPFEDSVGAVYVLSGYELDKILFKPENYEMFLSGLKLTQRIDSSSVQFKWLGFSLQVVPDIDDSGCDELAVGSPKSARVAVLRCVPAINASISYHNTPGVLKQSDNNFTVNVCIDISYNTKPLKISTKLTVNNIVQSNGPEAIINKPSFVVDLSTRPTKTCKNIEVSFKYEGIGTYYFSTEIKSNIDSLLEQKDFDSTWVRLSPHSKTENIGFWVNRACDEEDCTPVMTFLPILWNGQNVTEFAVTSTLNTANITMGVRNEGPIVFDACLRVRITGAQVLSIQCAFDDNGQVGAYKCFLPRPLPRNANYTLDISVSMSFSDDDKVHIEGVLFDRCDNSNSTTNKTTRDVNLIFTHEDVHIAGHSHSFNVTDTQLMNKKQLTIVDRHQYTISNKGSINWRDVEAVLTLPAHNYLQQHTISLSPGGQCFKQNITTSTELQEFKCSHLNLNRHSFIKLIVSMEIVKDKIESNLVNGELKIESKLILKPTRLRKITEKQTTTILFVKEMSFENNKNLIIALGVLGALIILAILILILYKLGFFKRKEKERLEEIIRKESIRRSTKSTNQSTAGPAEVENRTIEDGSMDDLDIEVVEECFQPVQCPEGLPDDTALIKQRKTSKSQAYTQE